MSEQDESSKMQTRQDVKLKAHGHNDPQLHRPQQVSILDGLVGEEASLSVYVAAPTCKSSTRRSPVGPRYQLHCSLDSTLLSNLSFP